MTNEQETLLMIKGLIFEMPISEKEKFVSLVENIKKLLNEAGEPSASLAIALIGAEKQLENS